MKPFTLHLYNGTQLCLHNPIEVAGLSGARAWLVCHVVDVSSVDKCEVRHKGKLVWIYKRVVHKWVAYKVETRKT